MQKLDNLYGQIPAAEFRKKASLLEQEAISLFKKAQKATNRNGEAGELLLYLLTEWILDAPQILAKMELKTNRQMPVHGADGVHLRYCQKSKRLLMYWGESKLYKNVDQAIQEAVSSIADALTHEKLSHEISLVNRHIDLSGLSPEAKDAILNYLDPLKDEANNRADIVMSLIGFDFDAFAAMAQIDRDKVEAEFKRRVVDHLSLTEPKLSKALKNANIDNREMEVFFFPVPSVQQLRDLFQAKIGWNN